MGPGHGLDAGTGRSGGDAGSARAGSRSGPVCTRWSSRGTPQGSPTWSSTTPPNVNVLNWSKRRGGAGRARRRASPRSRALQPRLYRPPGGPYRLRPPAAGWHRLATVKAFVRGTRQPPLNDQNAAPTAPRPRCARRPDAVPQNGPGLRQPAPDLGLDECPGNGHGRRSTRCWKPWDRGASEAQAPRRRPAPRARSSPCRIVRR